METPLVDLDMDSKMSAVGLEHQSGMASTEVQATTTTTKEHLPSFDDFVNEIEQMKKDPTKNLGEENARDTKLEQLKAMLPDLYNKQSNLE